MDPASNSEQNDDASTPVINDQPPNTQLPTQQEHDDEEKMNEPVPIEHPSTSISTGTQHLQTDDTPPINDAAPPQQPLNDQMTALSISENNERESKVIETNELAAQHQPD